MSSWVNDYEETFRVAFVTYESLLENPFLRLKKLFSADIIPPEYLPNDEKLQKATIRQSFRTRRSEIKSANPNKYPYGQTIQLKHMRKGTVGDWKNHFKRKHAKIAHRAWWKWLLYCGYETDENWWEQVEE